MSNREHWLNRAVEELTPLFENIGLLVPQVQVSIGFTGCGKNGRAIGECWPRTLAQDNVNHIFISPTLETSFEVLEVLTHELIHAIDDCKHKHGKVFKNIAKDIGLIGPMRATNAGSELSLELIRIGKKLGDFPHRKLKIPPRRISTHVRPGGKCPKCEYRVPMLKLYLQFGAPLCPIHKVQMEEIGDWNK